MRTRLCTRIAALILPLVLFAGIWCLVSADSKAYADDEVSGYLSDQVEWTYNSEYHDLTIRLRSGATSAPMPDFKSSDSAPWYTGKFYKEIENVYIEEGIIGIGSYAFQYCSNLTNVRLPESLLYINKYAFYDCSKLYWVELPENLNMIEMMAFRNCESLPGINIPASCEVIKQSAFSGCTALQKVVISPGLRKIEADVFNNCQSLKEINLPDTVTELDRSAFNGATALTAINIDANNKYYASANGVLYNKDFTELIRCPIAFPANYFIVHEGVTVICDYAFYTCMGLESITLPNSLKKIGYTALGYCSALKSLVIPDSVTYIGEGAFRSCLALDNIVLSKNITEIPRELFYASTKLRSVTIPEGVTSIGEMAFYRCQYLNYIVVPASVQTVEGYVCAEAGDLDVYYTGSEAQWLALKEANSENVDNNYAFWAYIREFNSNGPAPEEGGSDDGGSEIVKAANTLSVTGKTKTIKYKTFVPIWKMN